MDEVLKHEVIEYLSLMPVPPYLEAMAPDEKEKQVFAASEEIADVYPQIKQSPRMIALQAIYNAEAEDEGIAMMHRQGISDYTVKDVKAVLKRDNLSPYVLSLIKALPEMQDAASNGRVGWLI